MINKESKQQKSKFRKNKALMMSVYCGMLLATVIITYALTSQFYSDIISSDLSKKTVFQFNLSTQMEAATIGPGDSFNVQPEIYNDATEDMYVFIKIDMPTTYSGDSLYTFDVGEDWMLVSNQGGSLAYVYAGQDMIVLNPGDVE